MVEGVFFAAPFDALHALPRLSDMPRSAADVLHALGIDELPHAEDYETLAGFLMVMLRRVPRRTDSVSVGGYLFEVLDVDSYRIDQVMVSRIDRPSKSGEEAQASAERS